MNHGLIPYRPIGKLNLLDRVEVLNNQLIIGLRQSQRHRPKVLPKVLSDQQSGWRHPTHHRYRVDVVNGTPVLYGIGPAPHAKHVGVTAGKILQEVVANSAVEYIVASITRQTVITCPTQQNVVAVKPIELIISS